MELHEDHRCQMCVSDTVRFSFLLFILLISLQTFHSNYDMSDDKEIAEN